MFYTTIPFRHSEIRNNIVLFVVIVFLTNTEQRPLRIDTHCSAEHSIWTEYGKHGGKSSRFIRYFELREIVVKSLEMIYNE